MAGKQTPDVESSPAPDPTPAPAPAPEFDVAKLAADVEELKNTLAALIEGVNGIRSVIGDVEGVKITGSSIAEMLGTIGKFVVETAGVHL